MAKNLVSQTSIIPSVQISPVVRGFIPDGPQSGPENIHFDSLRTTESPVFTTAAQPNGDKSPHHRMLGDPLEIYFTALPRQ
ncbi:hypothetical protein [Pseudomonas sp. McL0111]|uniref:hypothetical protein n=1 Tax=Pseudomonas sp. McL0111 TaxID=3457357 RepID=UPI00403E4889